MNNYVNDDGYLYVGRRGTCLVVSPFWKGGPTGVSIAGPIPAADRAL